MTLYDVEQDPESGQTAVADDASSWMRNLVSGDSQVFSEFPYYTYSSSNDTVNRWPMPGTQATPREVSRHGPFRTDLVLVGINHRLIAERSRTLGHLISLNQDKSEKRKYRRSYLNFVKDGPMTRSYYENCHGEEAGTGPKELFSYSPSVSKSAFGWLKKRGFIQPVDGQGWDATMVPLHLSEVHVIELKRKQSDWKEALKQAKRAECFADFRWVAYDRDGAQQAINNSSKFQQAGIGLVTVSPDTVNTVVEPGRVGISDRELLNRHTVEKWDLNERSLRRIVDVDPHSCFEVAEDAPVYNSGTHEVRRVAQSELSEFSSE